MKSVLTLFVSLFSIMLYAQPGVIDNTYGIDMTGTVSVLNQLYTGAAATQPDNKLLVGGRSPALYVYNNFILARHNTDGTPDVLFGDKGQVVTAVDDLVPNIRYSFGWTSVAVQPDGKIVAAGSIGWTNPDYPPEYHAQFDVDIVVARFLPDGIPDSSFGSSGRVVTNLGYLENIRAVAVQKDGKIVVAGDQTTDFYDGNSNGILVARYNTNGTLDKSFGKYGGYTVYDYNNGGNYGYAMLLQPDGKIVVGGYEAGGNDFLVLRYLPDGKLDNSFGKAGAVKTTLPTLGAYTTVNSLALDEKGRICATGVLSSNQGVAVTRYLPDGSPDNSFDKDGIVELNLGNVWYSNGNTVLSQPGNKLVVSACVRPDEDTLFRETLTGLNEDGSLDASFGTSNGQTITGIGISDDAGVDAVMQPDGKIIISGTTNNYFTNLTSYLLTRFDGYPVHVSLAVRIRRWLQNHTLSWNGLPAEDKVAYYAVEQSNNELSGFAQVAKVSGAANLKDYSVTNSHLLNGANYYRVKAVSTDGVVRYSEIISANNSAASASVYPNPAKDYVTVQGLKSTETANIAIKDGSGNVLARGVSTGSEQYRSALGSNMQPGTYYLNITTGAKTEVLKFVKE